MDIIATKGVLLPNSPEPINHQIYRYLKRSIIECRLLPDDPLSENEVAAMFNISRQPVREALIKLSENGFVVIAPKRTTRVAKISVSELEQGLKIRRALESHTASQAAIFANADEIEALSHNVERQCMVARDHDVNLHFGLDDSFHRQIAEIAHIPKVWTIVEGLKGISDRLRFLSIERELAPIETTSKAHLKVLKALQERDPDAAERAMYEHVDATLVSMRKVIELCDPDCLCR